MSTESRVTLPRGAAILTAVALLLAGAGVTYLLMKGAAASGREGTGIHDTADSASRPATPPPASAPASAPGSADTAPGADVEIRLAPDAVKRAGIVVTAAASAPSASDLRLPGVVAPNAYRQVTVTPLVSGRVTSVSAGLGERVHRGKAIAQIYSPELAEAQTRYVSAVALLDAHDRELQRTQKLVDIGAASRQELERIHAEHTAQTGSVRSARAQLELLGVPVSSLDNAAAKTSSTTTAVLAPIDGVVTERQANVGLNVDPTTKLFTVVDLSNVWVLADVHERDLAGVRIGSEAAITSDGDAANVRRGRVSYIDPQVTTETRTAKARIELPNPFGELRLGMYVDVVVTRASTGSTTMIPRSAVQQIGGRTAVYVADPIAPATFIEREVRLGRVMGERIEVTAGVRPGDLVVSTGSFFVRAERERLGLRSRPRADEGHSAQAEAPTGTDAEGAKTVQKARVTITDQGFEPAKVMLKRGIPARLTFVRMSDKTCATEVVIPSLKVKRELPLNKPVDVELTPSSKSGEITFACGMNMLKGAAVVQ